MNTPWYCHQISIFIIFIQITFQGYNSFCGKVDYFFSLKKAFGIKLSIHVFINFFSYILITKVNIFLSDWNSINHTCTNINHFWLTDYKPQHHLRMTLYWDVSKFLSSWKLLLPPAPIKVKIWTFSLKIFVLTNNYMLLSWQQFSIKLFNNSDFFNFFKLDPGSTWLWILIHEMHWLGNFETACVVDSIF